VFSQLSIGEGKYREINNSSLNRFTMLLTIKMHHQFVKRAHCRQKIPPKLSCMAAIGWLEFFHVEKKGGLCLRHFHYYVPGKFSPIH